MHFKPLFSCAGGIVLVSALMFAGNAQAVNRGFDHALKAHLAAIDHRDSAAFEATLTASPHLTLVLPNGQISTSSADFKTKMRAWFADRDWSWTYTIVSQRSSAQVGVAVLQVNYTDTDEAGKPVRMPYVLTLVFEREKSGWKLVHDQNTLLPR